MWRGAPRSSWPSPTRPTPSQCKSRTYGPPAFRARPSETSTGNGKGQTRYGFEFTIPFTLSRYFGGRQGSAQQGPSGEVAAEVTLTNQLRYEPAAVTISAGQAVRWRNTSALIHTVTADPSRAMQAANVRLPAGANAFDSGDMAPGESFTWTFTEPGEYRYICIPHEGAAMTGTIMVR